MTPELITAKAELQRIMDRVFANKTLCGSSTTNYCLPTALYDALRASSARVRAIEKLTNEVKND